MNEKSADCNSACCVNLFKAVGYVTEREREREGVGGGGGGGKGAFVVYSPFESVNAYLETKGEGRVEKGKDEETNCIAMVELLLLH